MSVVLAQLWPVFRRVVPCISVLLFLPCALRAAQPVALPGSPTPVVAPRAVTPVDASPDLPAELPMASTPAMTTWPSPASPPAWIQWLGWSNDGKRLAWRQGPEWAQLLTGTPIEIVRLDERGTLVTHVHQRNNPGQALKDRHIKSTEPLFVERKTDRDVLLRSSTGRTFAIVVRPGKTSVAAVLEKKRRSYDPIARWLIRGPANRVDVMAFEDLSHRLLALVVHADSGPLRQAHLAVLPLSRTIPVQVSALTLPEAVTATSPRRP
jgi:hypothetical protein